MAKKQENTRRYLSAYIPEESKKYKSSRINWGGLNLKNIYNSGEMSFADGVNVSDLPYVDTQKKFEELSGSWTQKYKNDTILGFYIFDGGEDKGNVYVVVYSKESDTIEPSQSIGSSIVAVDLIYEKFKLYGVIVNANNQYLTNDGLKQTFNYYTLTYNIEQYPYNDDYTKYMVNGVVKTKDTAQAAYDEFEKSAIGTKTVRTIKEFNVYNSTVDPVGTDTTKKILVFPDKVSIPDIDGFLWYWSDPNKETELIPDTKYFDDLGVSENRIYYNFTGSPGNYIVKNVFFYAYIYNENKEKYEWKWQSTENTNKALAYLGDAFPNIKYACVNNQRLYGVDDVRVYVSGYNNYADFALDTADSDYSTAAGAWAVTTQASASRGGTFTAIVGFGEEAIAFKDNYMYRITGTTNPFRLRELCAVGCVDARSICELDGRLYFASQNAIYAYRDGYLPTPISTSIEPEIRNVQSAVGYIEDNRYHVIINNKEYIYDTLNGKWTMNHNADSIVAYAYKSDTIADEVNKPDELVFATDTGFLKQSDSYLDEWSFQTDFVNNFTSDLKKPHKLQLMYEIDPKASMRITLSDESSEALIYSCTNGESMRRINCARVLLRCDDLVNYSIKISGSGYVKLHAMEIIYEAGGELFE